jgi:phosphatidylserine/phosphatidylglycerophosphate/cardiolipin synthase-like enzyme
MSITTAQQQALTAIAAVARALPAAALEVTAARLQAIADNALTGPRIERLIKETPGFAHRLQLTALFRQLEVAGADLPPSALAWALRGAAAQDASHRAGDRLDLVWTGPETPAFKPRQSYGALIEVIDTSRQSLTIASFAAYHIEAVRAAILRAVERGVAVRLILESNNASAGKINYEPLAALGLDAVDGITAYVWPLAKRPTNAAGQRGCLHMKCAIADASLVLISSANLTDHAINLNMELGVIMHSKGIGTELSKLFESLIDQGILVAVRSLPGAN